jgi:exopolysaccharide production protein ExoY
VPGVAKVLRCAERVFALCAFLILLPVLAIVAVVVRLLSGEPPLVAHQRVGRLGQTFWMLKFRTMWGGARRGWSIRNPLADAGGCSPAHQGGDSSRASRGLMEYLPGSEPVPEIKRGQDRRVTSGFARVCRRYSIDELPQLWHVVRGEMSLVGPRPVTPSEWDRYYGPSAAEVLELRPGITGLWQTRGRNRLTYPQRRRLDLFLSRHYCLWLYLRILGATIPRVLAGRDAW